MVYSLSLARDEHPLEQKTQVAQCETADGSDHSELEEKRHASQEWRRAFVTRAHEREGENETVHGAVDHCAATIVEVADAQTGERPRHQAQRREHVAGSKNSEQRTET